MDRLAVGRGHVAVIDDTAFDGLAVVQRFLAVDGRADDADDVCSVGTGGIGEALACGGRGVRQLDDELGHVIPADFDVLHETERLGIGREGAVTVEVYERREGRRSLHEGAARGLAERERQLLVLHRRQLDVVHDAVEALRRRNGRVSERMPGDLRQVKSEVTGRAIDVAHDLHVNEQMPLLRVGIYGHRKCVARAVRRGHATVYVAPLEA